MLIQFPRSMNIKTATFGFYFHFASKKRKMNYFALSRNVVRNLSKLHSLLIAPESFGAVIVSTYWKLLKAAVLCLIEFVGTKNSSPLRLYFSSVGEIPAFQKIRTKKLCCSRSQCCSLSGSLPAVCMTFVFELSSLKFMKGKLFIPFELVLFLIKV